MDYAVRKCLSFCPSALPSATLLYFVKTAKYIVKILYRLVAPSFFVRTKVRSKRVCCHTETAERLRKIARFVNDMRGFYLYLVDTVYRVVDDSSHSVHGNNQFLLEIQNLK